MIARPRLNKKEKEVYIQVIKEWLAKDKDVSDLRIVWDLRTSHRQLRHHQTKQWGFVKRMRKIIEGEGKLKDLSKQINNLHRKITKEIK